MNREFESPFESIESAQEYIGLLMEAVSDAERSVESEVSNEAKIRPSPTVDALRLVLYNLEKLDRHLTASTRILNDLRRLRRLTLEKHVRMTIPTTQ